MQRETLAFQTLLAVARQREGLDEGRCRLVLEWLSTAAGIRAALHQEMSELRLTELKLGILVVLYVLAPAAATSADLATHTGGTRSAVSDAIDQLESAGLVGRTRASADRRVVYVHLQPEGQAAADIALAQFLRSVGQIARHVPPELERPVLAACDQLNAGVMRISPSA